MPGQCAAGRRIARKQAIVSNVRLPDPLTSSSLRIPKAAELSQKLSKRASDASAALSELNLIE